jgi:hypothetical protein
MDTFSSEEARRQKLDSETSSTETKCEICKKMMIEDPPNVLQCKQIFYIRKGET